MSAKLAEKSARFLQLDSLMTEAILAWALSAGFFLIALFCFSKEAIKGLEGVFLGTEKQKRALERVIWVFRELEETLASGLLPTSDRWDLLNSIASPWAELSRESLLELRSSGGSLLPTLRRLRGLAEEHSQAISSAQAKSAQAFAQAGVCTLLVPLLGVALSVMLPEVGGRSWWGLCFIAFLWAFVGSIWLFRMADSARWGGLPREKRPWVLASLCAVERFLAWVRSGTPPDLAWARMGESLSQDLFLAWGGSIWIEEPPKASFNAMASRSSVMENRIIQLSRSLKSAIQVSLMEGRPCVERVEANFAAFRSEVQTQIDQELTLLGTRALKPLFICVAPSLLGLLAAGLWITAQMMEV